VDVEDTVTPDKRFDEVITTESELRNIVGRANRWFTSKILNRLDRRCRDFIASSPFSVVGSTDPLGMVDLSPKGDRAGFVRCLDDATLAILRQPAGRYVPQCAAEPRRRFGLLCSRPARDAARRGPGGYRTRSGYQERDGGQWPRARARDDRHRRKGILPLRQVRHAREAWDYEGHRERAALSPIAPAS
jgi:hypothetical protein